jgi:hypothetical protein
MKDKFFLLQMCHGDNQDPEKKRRIRCAGLSGLLGVIRKTVNEDLAENIWEPKHMVIISGAFHSGKRMRQFFEIILQRAQRLQLFRHMDLKVIL